MAEQNQPSSFPCLRCRIEFSSIAARDQHIRGSLDHNVCHLCTYIRKDFESFSALQDHLENDHLYCEVCHWFAPSALGLTQHNISRHFMCGICKRYFVSIHELNGHAISTHRPRSALCILCDRDFPTLSSTFSHLESGNCTEGATRADIETLARDFFESHRIPIDSPFGCAVCHRPFQRMCDLLQHVETRACQEGYWRGSGSLGALVEHIRSNLRNAISARHANAMASSAASVGEEGGGEMA